MLRCSGETIDPLVEGDRMIVQSSAPDAQGDPGRAGG